MPGSLSHHRSIIVLLLVLTVASSACTSSGNTETTNPSTAPSAGSTIPVAQVGEGMEKGSPEELDEWVEGLSSKEKALIEITSAMPDPVGDAQTTGTIVDYTDILEASVKGNGKSLDLVLTMSGAVPDVMPNDTTFMIVAWNLAGSKRFKTLGFSAQAGSTGWVLSAAQNSDTTEFPGGFDVQGNTITLRIPWDYGKRPHEFDWSAAVTWTTTDQSAPGSSADNITGGRFEA